MSMLTLVPGTVGGESDSAFQCYYSDPSLISADIPSQLGQIIKALLYCEPRIQHKERGVRRETVAQREGRVLPGLEGAGEGRNALQTALR